MAKTANLYARIEPELKGQAEEILLSLGIPASKTITMFYRQIVLQRVLPFEVKLPANVPADASKLTQAELDVELEKGYANVKAGRARDAGSIFRYTKSMTYRMMISTQADAGLHGIYEYIAFKLCSAINVADK